MGIDASTFQASTSNTETFTAAAAAAMPPLTQADITINTVSNVASATRRQLRSLTSTSVNVGYTVMFTLASTGFSTIDAAYSSFSTNLNTSVTSGDFDTLLSQYSTYYGATAMQGVTSTQVLAISEPALVTSDDTEDDDNSSENKHLALALGLGLGLGGGLCCIALIVAFLWSGQKQPKGPRDKANVGLMHGL